MFKKLQLLTTLFPSHFHSMMKKRKPLHLSSSFSLLQFLFIKILVILSKTCLTLSSLSSTPLFSFAVALQVLILLYLPTLFLRLLFSPVLIFTAILLSFLVSLGSSQLSRGTDVSPPNIQEFHPATSTTGQRDTTRVDETAGNNIQNEKVEAVGLVPNEFPSEAFVEWSRKMPLEIIYEEYEGEDEEDGDEEKERGRDSGEYAVQTERGRKIVEGYANWALFMPESESGSSSDEEFPGDQLGRWDYRAENLGFKWEEDKEGMIEIALGRGGKGFDDEEEKDDLIEMELSMAGTWQISR